MTKLINPLRTLIVIIKIRGIKARILINSGYLNNFIFPDFVKKVQFHTQAKEYQYTFYGIDD
jgi:hypothetical protein